MPPQGRDFKDDRGAGAVTVVTLYATTTCYLTDTDNLTLFLADV